MKKTKIISIACQKGGVGKSTFTSILSTTLAYEFGLRVLVLDMDQQATLVDKRKKDLTQRGMDELMKTQNKTLTELNRDYKLSDYLETGIAKIADTNAPIYMPMYINSENVNMEKIIDTLNSIRRMGEYQSTPVDIVLCDTPGALSPNLLEVLYTSDGVIVPLVGSDADIRATVTFINSLNQMLDMAKDEGKTILAQAFLNKKSRTKEEKSIPSMCEKMNFPLMSAFLSDLVEYQRFSTILSFSRTDGVKRKTSDEVWSLVIELLDKMGIVKSDLSDYEQWLKHKPSLAQLLRPRLENAYFQPASQEESEPVS